MIRGERKSGHVTLYPRAGVSRSSFSVGLLLQLALSFWSGLIGLEPRAAAEGLPESVEDGSSPPRDIEVVVTVRTFEATPEFSPRALDAPGWRAAVARGVQGNLVLRADLDGDGRDGIVVIDPDRNELHAFDANEVLTRVERRDIPIRQGAIPQRFRAAAGDLDGDSLDDLALFDLTAHQLTTFFLERSPELVARAIDIPFPPLRNVRSVFSYREYPDLRSTLVFYLHSGDPRVGGGGTISYRFSSRAHAPENITQVRSGYVPATGVSIERDGPALLALYSVKNVLGSPDFRQGIWRGRQLVANLPLGYEWGRVFSGDFNGDRRQDLIFEGFGIQGSWIAIGGDGHLIEQTLPQRLDLGGDRDLVLPGDYDGDGFTDLAVLSTTGIRVLRAVPGTPIGGAEVVIDGGTPRPTGADGALRVTVQVEADSVTIPLRRGRRPISAEYVGMPPWSRLSLASDRISLHYADVSPGSRRNINLFTERPYNEGQPVAFGPVGDGPYVCTGYRAIASYAKWGRSVEECPPDYAMFELDDTRHMANGVCCRLPSSDILTEERSWISSPECPDDSIVVGTKLEDVTLTNGRMIIGKTSILCARIDTRSYALGPRVPGQYWGTGMSAGDNEIGTDPRTFESGLRAAVGRSDFENWDLDGCIGSPPGLLLASTAAADCKATVFRQLLRRERTTDGKETQVPVVMFRRCRTTPNRFDPLAGCEELPHDPTQPQDDPSKEP